MSHVLAVLEQRDGALRKVSHEVVTGARRLADALGENVDALLLAGAAVPGMNELGRLGADKLTTLTNPAFRLYAPEGYARAIADRAKAGGYRAVVFAASATGKDLESRRGWNVPSRRTSPTLPSKPVRWSRCGRSTPARRSSR